MTGYVEPHPHEFDAHLIFAEPGEDGLRPYYALERLIRQNNGSKRATLTLDGERFSIKLYYQTSGFVSLNHPSSDLETLREFRIQFECLDAEGDEKSGNYHISPRTPKLRNEDGLYYSPFTGTNLTGVNIRVQGSNIEFSKYYSLLVDSFRALGLNPNYVSEPHDWSNINDMALEVRIARSRSGPLYSHDGTIERIAHVLTGDRSGYRKRVADDRKVPGYYHTATFGPDRARELLPHHTLPKEVKHYLPNEPESFDKDEPLYHPKLGVSYQSSLKDESLYWKDLSDARRELDELLINVLAWTKLPVRPKESTDENGEDPFFIADHYFEPTANHRPLEVVPDPTPEIQQEQENAVIQYLATHDGFNESDEAILDRLVSDGGEISPQDLDADLPFHLSTIYRALDRLEDLIQHEYGKIELVSRHMAEQISGCLRDAKDRGKDAFSKTGSALKFAKNPSEAPLVKWLESYGVEVEDKEDARLKIRFGDRFPHAKKFREVVHSGLMVWRHAGFNPDRFKNAVFTAEVDGARHVHPHGIPEPPP